VPPRLRSAFSEARRRLLPAIVQQKYVVAKTAFDQKDYGAAAQGFTQVLAALSDPDIEAASAQPPLADIRMLASGFHDLAAKAAAPPPAPVPVAPPVPEPIVDRTPRVYGAADGNVVPPVTLRQTVPAYPGRVMAGGATTIEIVIDEAGAVETATMDTPLNPIYDRMALAATKNWQYQPATLNGKPVKYRKRIQITLVVEPR
jgi:TonB family protein